MTNEMVAPGVQSHPAESFLRTDSMPSVWCPGCGIGTVVLAFIKAVHETKIEPGRVSVVSGLGCTSKIASYLGFQSFTILDGKTINFAAHLKSEKSEIKVVVFLNNADLLLNNSNDFIEVAKGGTDLTVIHINNLIYTITENDAIPNTPFVRMVMGRVMELPFNIPHWAKLLGARYIARWTPLRAGWLTHSLIDALKKTSLSIVEVVMPCLVFDANHGKIGDAAERMEFYDRNSEMKPTEPTENLDIRLQKKIIIGKFVDR